MLYCICLKGISYFWISGLDESFSSFLLVVEAQVIDIIYARAVVSVIFRAIELKSNFEKPVV